VQDAADAPAQTPELVGLGSSLAAVEAYQANLVRVQAEANGADQALGSAVSLVEQARTLAVQAANTVLSPEDLQTIATQVQGIQQQIAGIANTTVEGRYIFGGNLDQSAPYQFDTNTGTVAALTAPGASRVIANPQGEAVYQGLTAQHIFDPQDAAGAPTGDNAVAGLQSLQNALQNNDQPGIAAALTSLQNVSTWLNQQQAYYGTAEQRITSEQNDAAGQSTALQVSIAGIRDTNIAQAATDLTQETTNQSAAYGAEAAVSRKSLFDYLG
jgi:flagellar hook-associated protein 3 FlgL